MSLEQAKMILKTLTMRNYRAFEELKVDFHDQLTVIVGANGAGKTTILDAAAVALSAYLSGFDDLGLYKIMPYDARVKCIKMGDIEFPQPQYNVEIEATAEVFCPHSKSGKKGLDVPVSDIEYYQTVTWKRLRTSDSVHARQKTKEMAPMEKIGAMHQDYIRIGQTLNISFVSVPILAYYSTRRLWENGASTDMLKTTILRQDAYKDCLDAHLNLSTLKTWFERMTYKSLQAGKESRSFAAVKRAMEQVFEGISGTSETNVRMNLDTREIEIWFFDKNNRQILTMSQLSDGYKGTVCLVADIAYRMAVLNPHLEENVLTETGGVVLIDEVDLHLHPAWQQRILHDLTEIFPKVQFVVTTHAPAVINTVGQEHIRIMKNGGISPAPVETYGKDTNGVMTTIMEVEERPEPVKKQFENFYIALQKRDYDLAETILDELEEIIGEYDPDLITCRMKLDLDQM